ncbi:MAG: twin-arginine translocation signal domain-containing protein, partial [Xanthomonadales bacterium]|nr:twin-arginine translocation signal domain-containing protein [Gammaproteobacteria bacterium]NNK05384.1 twin-arginine translocation signal domain-containing protein [Xanthomonadales bacterium]
MKKDLLLKDGNPQQGNPLGGTLGESLRSQGVSRRSFMKFCATTASMMALPPSMIPMIANALENARRPSV